MYQRFALVVVVAAAISLISSHLAIFPAHDLIRPSFARRPAFAKPASAGEGRSGLRTRVRPLAGPSTGSGGKPVLIPDRVEDKLFGIMRQPPLRLRSACGEKVRRPK